MPPLIVLLILTLTSCQTLARSVNSTYSPASLTRESSTKNILAASHTKPLPTNAFEYEFMLDEEGNYWLFWNVSDQNITFEVHVRTRGYVGFGLTSNGKMFPSDVVVGWVKPDGSVYFHVRLELWYLLIYLIGNFISTNEKNI